MQTGALHRVFRSMKVCLAPALLLALSAAAQQPAVHPPPQVSGVENAVLVQTLPLNGRLFHVQGIDVDAAHLWVTSVDKEAHKGYLHEFDRRTGNLIREVEVTDGPRFHPGGFSLAGESIWVPVAEYRAHSSAVIEEIDRRTLTIKRKIPVADHLGCVAFTGSELIAGNWDSRQFYVLDLSGKVVRVFDNPSTTQYQDIKFADGKLIGSGSLTPSTGAIDWFAWPSMKLLRTVKSGVTDRQKTFTGEGMAIKGKDLYLLPEDGPSTRLFHFTIASPAN